MIEGFLFGLGATGGCMACIATVLSIGTLVNMWFPKPESNLKLKDIKVNIDVKGEANEF